MGNSPVPAVCSVFQSQLYQLIVFTATVGALVRSTFFPFLSFFVAFFPAMASSWLGFKIPSATHRANHAPIYHGHGPSPNFFEMCGMAM